MFTFSQRSVNNLKGVHPDLVKVVYKALEYTPIDFVVTEGLRTKEKQASLVASGASRTTKSRHLTGHAIDFAALLNREIRWDWPLYVKIADAFKRAGNDLNIPIEWGGDWTSFKDGPHIQLPWKQYP